MGESFSGSLQQRLAVLSCPCGFNSNKTESDNPAVLTPLRQILLWREKKGGGDAVLCASIIIIAVCETCVLGCWCFCSCCFFVVFCRE